MPIFRAKLNYFSACFFYKMMWKSIFQEIPPRHSSDRNRRIGFGPRLVRSPQSRTGSRTAPRCRSGTWKCPLPGKLDFLKRSFIRYKSRTIFYVNMQCKRGKRVRFLEIKFYLFSQIESALSQTGIQIEASGSENCDIFFLISRFF